MTIGLFMDPTEGIYVLEGNGPVQTKKYLEMDDVRDILLQNVSLETGLLPKGCQYYLRQDGKTIVILEQEAKISNVSYSRRRTGINQYEIPLPYTVFGLLYEGGTLVESYAGAMRMPITSMDTEVYRMPFGNVYPDFRICWGAATVPRIRNISEATQIPALFFDAPFNGDLIDGSYDYNGSFNDYLSYLDGKDFFPYDTMVTSPRTTVGQIISQLKSQAGLV